jgi:hypothetical protein
MTVRARFAVLVGSLLTVATHSHASLVTFDDIDASAGDVSLQSISPYAGFLWSNVSAYTTTPGFQGFNNGIVSGANAAYGGGQVFSGGLVPVVSAITSASLFDFTSASLGAGYYDDLTVTLIGMRAGTNIYSRSLTVNTAGAMRFDFDFVGIDTLLIQGNISATSSDPFGCGTFNCTQFTIDDMSVAPSAVTGVPEPATAALVLLALFGVYGTRRKA